MAVFFSTNFHGLAEVRARAHIIPSEEKPQGFTAGRLANPNISIHLLEKRHEKNSFSSAGPNLTNIAVETLRSIHRVADVLGRSTAFSIGRLVKRLGLGARTVRLRVRREHFL